MDYSERLLRQRDREAPRRHLRGRRLHRRLPGRPNPANRDLRIKATVTVEGSDIHVDLTGTSPQIDLPLNMPFEGTVDIAIYLTIRSILLDSARTAHPGELRALPADHDHGARGLPGQPALPGADDRPLLPRQHRRRHGDARAGAASCRSNVSAGVGNLKVVAYSGLSGDAALGVHGHPGGQLRWPAGKDGLDAVDTLYANTRNNPIEDIESHYPLRVTRYELNVDPAGAGRWRGGIGTIRESSSSSPAGCRSRATAPCIRRRGCSVGEMERRAASRSTSAVRTASPYRRSSLPCDPGWRPALSRRSVRRRLRARGRAGPEPRSARTSRTRFSRGSAPGSSTASRTRRANRRRRRRHQHRRRPRRRPRCARRGEDADDAGRDRSGISSAISALVESSGVAVSRVQVVMIGTTHFTNAVVEAQRLARPG